MNEPAYHEATSATAEYCAELDQYVRRNPSLAIVLAVGTGLAMGLLVRALRPEPTPRYRAARLLADLEDRLRDVTRPVLRKAGSLASDGLDAAHLGGARAESLLTDAARRMRRMFS